MHFTRIFLTGAGALALAGSVFSETLIRFEKQVLETQFYAEGASFGDINGDGKNDVVYGPFWFEGPDFKIKHTFYTPKPFDINGYSDNFFSYVTDLDGDGFQDVLVLGFPGKEARLYVNPGKDVANVRTWPMHLVADVVDNESPDFTDVTGDGKPELVCSRDGQFGYYAPAGKVTDVWKWHPLTGNTGAQKFTHGMGVGDVNGDGKLDLLEAKRWWEQPAEKGEWKPHTFDLTGGGGAQMFAYDFNGDGRNDIVTALNAHGFGVAWFENKTGGEGAAWKRNLIVGQEPWENEYGVRFSQPHAMALVDMDGDGIKDIVTGKRYWAHNGKDPNERDPRVLYWFQTKRGSNGEVTFVPHLIDGDTGVGTQLTVGDIDGDGLPDVLVGNKYGFRVLLQRRDEVNAERFAQFQPKKIYGPERILPTDYKSGQSAADAVKSMTLPPGFVADIIAAEPDAVQPIAMCFDEKGRLWVAEGNSYPQRRPEEKGVDRILIFEDTQGTGKYDKRTIFMEGLNLVSGLEVGFGGVWIGSAPNLLFIPDQDRDDKPDGPPVVLLDGWGFQDTHETLNSFTWGPDGWLYGCHGVFTHSRVGKPGTPDAQRAPINAGIWRYHPVRHEFEIYAQGTSNPWGLDYNDKGDFFITACVIPHLYHVMPGGRYQRQAGQHFNPYTYDDIKTIADHAHFAGSVGDNAHWGDRKTKTEVPVAEDTDQAGGGHAHCGLAIYNGDNFPVEYRGALIFGNLHGHRLLQDHVDPKGSGYTGQHRADFMKSNDHWFIPVSQKVGPDGSLYVSDWSDKQVCHQGSDAINMWDRSNGRIYRISYDKVKPRKVDLTKLSDDVLVEMLLNDANEYFVRQSRKVLMERAAAGTLAREKGAKISPVEQTLYKAFQEGETKALRALWCLGALSWDGKRGDLRAAMVDPRESIRGVGVKLLMNRKQGNGLISNAEFLLHEDYLKQMAANEKSPAVRREIASLLQCLPLEKRAEIGKALIARKEDAEDQNIPYLIWYGIEPLIGENVALGLEFARSSQIPKVTSFIYRRLADHDAGRLGLLQAIAGMEDVNSRENTLGILMKSVRNAGKLSAPENWNSLRDSMLKNASPEIMAMTDELAARFGDSDAIERFRNVLADSAANVSKREAALAVLLQCRDVSSAKILQKILSTELGKSTLRRKVIQAMASLSDAQNATVLLDVYAALSPEEKADAISTLASTQQGGALLLKAVLEKKVEQHQLTPFLVRQLQSLENAEVNELIAKAYGAVNPSKADLAQRKATFRALLTPEKLKGADLKQGKLIYAGTCGACHPLMGEGAKVGPDLTGSNRANLDYLLDNVLDPNAVIGKDYQLNLFTMKDGRVLSGILKEENAETYIIVMPGGAALTLAKSEVAKREVSKFSTMPEGQFEALPSEMVVNLVAYLQSNASGEKRTVKGALEAEAFLSPKVSGGGVRNQPMGSFRAGSWSGDSQLWWTGDKIGDTLNVTFNAEKGGRQKVFATFTKAPDYAVIDVLLDGKSTEALNLDLYDPTVKSTGEILLGEFDLVKGAHVLTIKITGKNDQAKPAMMVGMDYIKLDVTK